MKFYLSSYKLGSQENANKLKAMTVKHTRTAYISNALDFAKDIERRSKGEQEDMNDLKGIGLHPEMADLREYFGKKEELKNKLQQYDVIRVRGGNCFVLMQAMKLSGFDEILKERVKSDRDIIYGGYSAGICILGPTLKGIHIADDPEVKPYGNQYETIRKGLSILDYVIAPHFKSDHKESEAIGKAVEYMKSKNIPFKTLRDGEVIIIE